MYIYIYIYIHTRIYIYIYREREIVCVYILRLRHHQRDASSGSAKSEACLGELHPLCPNRTPFLWDPLMSGRSHIATCFIANMRTCTLGAYSYVYADTDFWWHYLSNATCLMQPRLFSTAIFVESG